MVEFPQSLERMTPAVGIAHDAIKRREVSHDGDEALEYQVLNAVARFNDRGFTIAKARAKYLIDATVAMCLAVHGGIGCPEARQPRMISMASVLAAAGEL